MLNMALLSVILIAAHIVLQSQCGTQTTEPFKGGFVRKGVRLALGCKLWDFYCGFGVLGFGIP